jgi:cytochrome c
MTMKRLINLLCMLVTSTCFMGAALAQEQGTKDEAKAMVDAAVEHVKKVGPVKAFEDFTVDKATWSRKDLYVMAYDATGTCVGHGANAKLIGKNLIELKDPNGKLLVKELTETAMTKGSGWVEYDWPHPITKKIEGKVTYVRKLANFGGWVGVGIYR